MLTIKQRQQNLKIYYNYYKGSIDGVEGTGTKSAYKNFQRDNGLTADGIYGSNTENKLKLCIKNLQSILNKYGYNLSADGIIGNATINAIKDFQSKNGLTVDGIAGKNTISKLENTSSSSSAKYTCKYFKDSEFTCKCGCGKNITKNGIKKIADEIREHFGVACTITSGTRCVSHNKKVGGVAGSYHTTGNAFDIVVSGVSGSKVLEYTNKLKSQGKIRYTYGGTKQMGNAVHCDTGGME